MSGNMYEWSDCNGLQMKNTRIQMNLAKGTWNINHTPSGSSLPVPLSYRK